MCVWCCSKGVVGGGCTFMCATLMSANLIEAQIFSLANLQFQCADNLHQGTVRFYTNFTEQKVLIHPYKIIYRSHL